MNCLQLANCSSLLFSLTPSSPSSLCHQATFSCPYFRVLALALGTVGSQAWMGTGCFHLCISLSVTDMNSLVLPLPPAVPAPMPDIANRLQLASSQSISEASAALLTQSSGQPCLFEYLNCHSNAVLHWGDGSNKSAWIC